MPDRKDGPNEARAHIVEALRWADAQGLLDVGIHLNSALIAFDEAEPASSHKSGPPLRLDS